MPFGDYEDFEACVAANSDKDDPEAYCAAIKRQIEGAAALSETDRKAITASDTFSDKLLEEDPCWADYVMVGTKTVNGKEVPNCVPEEDADPADLQALAAADDRCGEGKVRIGDSCVDIAEVTGDTESPPPSVLSSPQHLTLKSLDTEPIERVEEGGNTVRYKSLKLLSPGVWSDAGSQTATYYPPDGIANLQAEYDESEYDGPPVNIMHDLDMDTFEAHDASVAGHIDPDTLDTDDEGNLFADIVFDTSTGAGQFADENLQSTLENEGTVGFGGPSVEIPAEGLVQEHDAQRDMPRVDGGLLSGCAMVMDPASKSVNFAREAARRPVAMSASGESGKVLTHESVDMRTLADAGEIRETLGMFGLDTDDLDDEEVMDMAEDLHEDLMDELEGDDAEMGDYEDDDEDEEDAEMEDDMDEEEEDDEDEMEMADDMETVMERVQNLASRLEDVEDAMSQAMTAEDVDAELEDAAGNKLADAETVKTLTEAKEELEDRIKELENQPAESKTLTDAQDFEPEYDMDSGARSGW
jgi:hypothetical protein